MTGTPFRLRTLAASVAVAALAFGATACGGGSDNQAAGTANDAGTLTLGVIGNNKDEVQPYTPTGSASESALKKQLYNGLTTYNAEGAVVMDLAESFTPSKDHKTWTVKLKDGVMRHDGKQFTADDVIASVKYILDPKSAYPQASQIDYVDESKLKKIDNLTVEFGLTRPIGLFPEAWANSDLLMRAIDDNGDVTGTGPFTLDSFTAGQEAKLTRFADYFGDQPGFTHLEIMDFQDQQAITNALRGGQIDVAYSVPFTDVKTLTTDPNIKTVISDSATYLMMSMRVDQAPFNDPKVQEALKLVMDREQIKQNAFGGYATIANDYMGNNSSCPAPDVAQRTQDIEKAKQLLAEAGQSNLNIELVTDGAYPGMMETAQLFAQQASQAGVTVNVKKLDAASFLNRWTEWPFAITLASGPYAVNAPNTFLPKGVENASHFDNAEFTALVEKMQATTDQAEQCKLIDQMQTIEYNSGGNLVPVYSQTVTAYRSNVEGLKPDLYGRTSITYAGVTVND